MGGQHDKNRLADDDASGGVVRELRVVRIAERLEEGQRLRQVGHREVDEYLCAHGFLFSC